MQCGMESSELSKPLIYDCGNQSGNDCLDSEYGMKSMRIHSSAVTIAWLLLIGDVCLSQHAQLLKVSDKRRYLTKITDVKSRPFFLFVIG